MKIFGNFTKIGAFSKNNIKKISSEIFFTKYDQNVDMKNVQELNFCPKNDQIMGMSNKPK